MDWNIFWGTLILMLALFLTLIKIGGGIKLYRGRHRASGHTRRMFRGN